MGSVGFILNLMKELDNFMQRISVSQFIFPAFRCEGGSRFHHFWLLQHHPGWYHLATWPDQKSWSRCDTVECRDYQGLLVLKLFMASVKSDLIQLLSVICQDDTNSEKAAKSNNDLVSCFMFADKQQVLLVFSGKNTPQAPKQEATGLSRKT